MDSGALIMALYKLIKDDEGREVAVTKDCTSYALDIPFSEGNTDYAEFLEWKAAGNTPEAAD